jgi:glycosyltransferase involved in cell wall biosynthesis
VIPVDQPCRTKPLNYQLSLVIPALDEQDTIAQAIWEADSALAGMASRYEIIVVDDGSTDRTAAIVEGAGKINPNVRLVRHETNAGYGAALRTGFQAAVFDLVGFTDADCQFDMRELAFLLPMTEMHEVVCSYRIGRQDSRRRRFLSWGYNRLAKMFLGIPVHDIDCALKLFQRRCLPEIMPQSNNFFVNTEMLSRACQAGLSVAEVGVHHRPRAAGASKVSLRDIPKTLFALLSFWWSQRLFPRRGGVHEPLETRV